MAGSAEADHELQMARSQLYKIAQYAIKLHEMTKQITDPNGLEPWQSAKLTKASDYMSAVYHNLEYNLKYKPNGEPTGELGAEAGEIAVGESKKKKYGKMKETSDPYMKDLRTRLKLREEAVSKKQQEAAGIALKHKREGTKPKEGIASAKMMSMSEAELEKIAGTEHKGLPDKKNEAKNNYDSFGTFTGGQNKPGGSPSARDRGIDDDDDEKYLAKKKAKESGTWYLRIDGKLWKKAGKPVEFSGKQAANKAGLTLQKKIPNKKVTITPNANTEN